VFLNFLRHGLFSDKYKSLPTQDRLRLWEWCKH